MADLRQNLTKVGGTLSNKLGEFMLFFKTSVKFSVYLDSVGLKVTHYLCPFGANLPPIRVTFDFRE